MLTFLAEHWAELLLSVLSAILIGFCRYLGKQINDYKRMIDAREDERIENLIEAKIEPVVKELDELRDYILKGEGEGKERLRLIVSSYKFRVIQLCKMYLRKGSMTQDEYDQLTEFYKIYSGLGGNGQGKDYYNKTIRLPIKEEE